MTLRKRKLNKVVHHILYSSKHYLSHNISDNIKRKNSSEDFESKFNEKEVKNLLGGVWGELFQN